MQSKYLLNTTPWAWRILRTTVLSLFLLSSAAMAQTVEVTIECDSTEGNDTSNPFDLFFNDLQVALGHLQQHSDKTKTHMVTLTGTCVPQPAGSGRLQTFTIKDFARIEINRRNSGASAILQQPVDVNCTGEDNNLSSVLIVRNVARASIENVAVIGGEGIQIEDSSVELRNVTVSGSTRKLFLSFDSSDARAIRVGGTAGSRLTLSGISVVTDSCGHGVVVDADSAASIARLVDVTMNNGFGVFGPRQARVDIGGEISHNGWGGVLLGFNSVGSLRSDALIEWNGQNPDLSDPLSAFNAGIAIRSASVFERSFSEFDPTATALIQLNSGPGIMVELNSTLSLGQTLTLMGNEGGGINLGHNSVAHFAVPGITLIGNGGGGFTDVNCDKSSEAFGDLSGASGVQNACNK